MNTTTGMKTRNNEGRPTSNIEKRAIIANKNAQKKKKQKTIESTNNKTDDKATKPSKSNSGTSSSENSDDEYEDMSDNENENKANPTESSGVKNEINKPTTTDVNNQSNKQSKSQKSEQSKSIKYRSIFNLNLKSKILLFVRNELFKKIKILGNEHLQPDGAIMQEALKRVQFDPEKHNLHAYMQECKKLLKQTMCSRRGYVKKKIGKTLRGKTYIICYIAIKPILTLRFSNPLFADFIKSDKLDFSFISDMQHFYKQDYVNDKNVRKSWFFFCYYFLPICNKDWKDHLQLDRLNKTEIIYKQITTSDEAIVNFFLQLWAPKIQIEKDNKWPTPIKTHGEGDQELKARINEYSAIHHSITKYKSFNKGEFATTWNDIFWQEVKEHFPNSFDQNNIDKMMPTDTNEIDSDIPLPGIDDDHTFSMFVETRKLTSSATSSATNNIETNEENKNSKNSSDLLQSNENATEDANSIQAKITNVVSI
jgi:hypothetical protein